MASSSVIPPKEKYDVFLNFRGQDTRRTFTSHLHAALIRRKVETYIDYRLERGDEVGPTLLKSIKESKISVIIFSNDYASSTWCLDELAYILECKETHGQHVIPIFYEIEPSQVRYQTGSYETAFAQHEQWLKDKTDKVAKWKEALVKAANLSGCDSTSKKFRHDSDLVEQVVRDVLAKLNCESSSDLTGLIGVEGRIEKILLELDIIPEDVRVRSLVIWGMGGIGKTTLAGGVFHRLSSQFEAHCFLQNVRERSGAKGASSPELYLLRNELLGELLGDRNLAICTPTIGAFYKERLRNTKVLVVLDDVNHSSQLTFLLGEVSFGPGSRIIITTRDMQPVRKTLLVKEVAGHDVKIYEVEELNGVESLQLFHSNARTHCIENPELLEQVADHAAGVPLALKILSSLFLQCESKEEQELLWEKLKKFPDDDLQNVYRASFDGLKGNEREIFLDIACFHKKEKLCDAKRMLAACGLFPDNGIKILTNMSLISIKDNCIWMHDVIQEMGWKIVREECTEEPGKRSRLHNGEDVCHVLKRNMGTAKVQSISSRNCVNTLMLDPQAFTRMHNLRFLMLRFIHLDDKENIKYLPDALQYLFWHSYPLKSFPSKFSPNNLVELHMPWSKLKRLWNKGQNPKNLKSIDLSYSMDLADVGELSNSVNIESINLQGCKSLVQVPDLSECVYIKSINLLGCASLVQVPDLSKSVNIESINLQYCTSLVEVPSYFQKFTRLTHLNLGNCWKNRVLQKIPSNMEFLHLGHTAIEELPPSIWSLEKLLILNLRDCSAIKNFPSSPWKMKSLTHLLLSGTNIETVPSSSFMCMTGIISLELRDCQHLVSLPTDICKFKSLERLDLFRCRRFTKFPEIAEPMEHLEYLNLSGTKIEELPSSVGNLVGLKTLDLSDCTSLELLPNNFYNLNLLEWFSLRNCVQLKKLPLSFILCSLINLNLSGCKLLEEIPDCITSFPALQVLDLSHTMIETIPPSIKQVSRLKNLFLNGCEWLQSLPVLPCLLKKLVADECTRLKTVSVSVTAQTEGLDQIVSGKKRTERHTYYGCDNLDKNARSNIMDDAHFRIMRMATACNLKRLSSGKVDLMGLGNEIPKWFSCQTEGSSMNIKLPLHWSDDSKFLGIALCSVSAIHAYSLSLGCQCEMILKTNGGETHSVNLGTTGDFRNFQNTDPMAEPDQVLVWYDTVPVISDEAKWSMEASFHFYTVLDGKRSNNVKRCGVCFLYAQSQDDDAPKFEVIRTVPSLSFMCVTGTISLDLSYCDRLVSLPADICKLKYLERLNLSGCRRFTKFPDIVEPMEHLQYLNLSGTNIKKLPSTIGNLVGLKTLILTFCKSLELLPDSFYNLNLLEWFSLEGCVKLEKLPLSFNNLNLLEWFSLESCVKLEKMPLSFSLCSLINLSFRGCILLEEIPDCFNSFPALQVLDLSETMIETIPPSIKQVFGLKSLLLDQCKRLQSLPVLPWLLEEFYARDCWRLKTVPVSVTAQAQGLDQVLSGYRYETHSFVGCVNLDNNSRSNIMDDAHIRIMRIATACNLKRLSYGDVEVMCPGNEIPKWFSCQTEGSSMNIKLPLHWSDNSNFLGIALCSVSAIHEDLHHPEYQCEMILKTNNGETHSVNLGSEECFGTMLLWGQEDDVSVWYNKVPAISDEAKWSTEASFDFYRDDDGRRWNNVKRCGVCFLYVQGQDDDALKFEVIRPQQVTTQQVTTQQVTTSVATCLLLVFLIAFTLYLNKI